MGILVNITPFTMIDYPGELAAIAWFSGCNLRCSYCHNNDLIMSVGKLSDDVFTDFLKSHVGKLTAIVFSGGEATYAASLIPLAMQAKSFGYKVKLDTNGSRPDVVEKMYNDNLLDYIALDYKCPDYKAAELLGTDYYISNFHQTLKNIISYKISKEVRITYHPELLNEDDLNSIIADLDNLCYTSNYYIQCVSSYGKATLGNINKPSSKIRPKNLIMPKNFSISFRNFELE